MIITNKVWGLLESDLQLRMKVAVALGLGEAAIKGAIKRRSDTLTKIAAIKAIEEHTGLTEDEIIETIKA